MTKFVFVTGGVISGLGKGVALASIGKLLEESGHKIGFLKLDPYLNVDCGTMSPEEHGEVFVTEDGKETDLDLGHYERFTHVITSGTSNLTMGQINKRVIEKERKGEYLGQTVQIVPHITNEIKYHILEEAAKTEILLVEIGGTVGDLESMVILESIRELRQELGLGNSILIHLGLIINLPNGEIKTKPIQHSVQKLNSLGLFPDMLLCRCKEKLSVGCCQKIARFTNLQANAVFSATNVSCIYDIPHLFHLQQIDTCVLRLFDLTKKSGHVKFMTPRTFSELHIGVVAKYTSESDAYKSLQEAFIHVGFLLSVKIQLVFLDAETVTNKELASVQGIVVPGGFGIRGLDGKLKAAKFARESNTPYFGICLGMQVAIIEYARNVIGLKNANSTEFDLNTPFPVVSTMKEWETNAGEYKKPLTDIGGSMRLGSYECVISKNSKVSQIYSSQTIHERHRHRYEVSSDCQVFTGDMRVSGQSKNSKLVEIIELTNHPWFIGCQFHPEFKSNPRVGHPLFLDFIRTIKKK